MRRLALARFHASFLAGGAMATVTISYTLWQSGNRKHRSGTFTSVQSTENFTFNAGGLVGALDATSPLPIPNSTGLAIFLFWSLSDGFDLARTQPSPHLDPITVGTRDIQITAW
jgi:hypothetical protein